MGRVGGRQQALPQYAKMGRWHRLRLASYPTRPMGDPYGSLSAQVGISRPPDCVAMLAPITSRLGFGIALRSAPNRRAAKPHEMGLYHRDLVLAQAEGVALPVSAS